MKPPYTLLGFVLSTGYILNEILDEADRELLATAIETAFPPYTVEWYRNVNEQFQMIFSRIYGYGYSREEHVLWLGIAGAYVILFVARVIIWLFGVPTPRTTRLLTTAIAVSTAAVLLAYGTFGSQRVLTFCESVSRRLWLTERTGLERGARIVILSVCAGAGTVMIATSISRTTLQLPVFAGLCLLATAVAPLAAVSLLPESTYPVSGSPGTWVAVRSFCLVAAGMGLYFAIVSAATVALGGSTAVVVALGVGTSLAVPGVYGVFLVPEDAFSINPVRAVASSLLFVWLVGSVFKGAAGTFLDEFQRSGVLVASFLAFNVFADAISLIETKWILEKSQSASRPVLVALLLADLALSVGIYLVLPVFVGQDLSVFFEAVLLRGPDPWMGVLFWSTLSTSAFFYLFAGGMLLLQALEPLMSRLKRFGESIQYEENPVLFVAVAIDLIVLALYGTWEYYSWIVG